MKIAFAVRAYQPDRDPVSRYVRNMCSWLRPAGHQTYLITDAPPPVSPDVADVVVTPPPEPDHDYFGDDQEYADRVREALRVLDSDVGLDVAEFPDRGGQGLGAIRAKRLLGEFSRLVLAVRLHRSPGIAVVPGSQAAADYRHSIRRFAEDYCVRHADLVTAPFAVVDGSVGARSRVAVRCPPPLSRDDLAEVRPLDDRPKDEVVFGGPLDPSGGADVFLRLADLVARRSATTTFTLYGTAAARPHFGRPYREQLERLITPGLRGRVSIVDAYPVARPAVWEGARWCVFPSRTDDLSLEGLEAMSRGSLVIAGAGSGLAGIIEHGRSGFVVDPDDLVGLERMAELILRPPTGQEEIAARAVDAVRRAADPEVAVPRVLSAYRGAAGGRPPAPVQVGGNPLVSVIVPVFNQGRLVEETIASVRASDYSPVEIIVVDDGSRDAETRATVDALAGVTKICKPNGGPGSAFNAGLREARGEFVLPLDGDDLIDPAYLTIAVRALLTDPSLAYLTCYVRYFGMMDLVHAPVGHVRDLMHFMDTEGKRSKVFRRAALEEVGGFDENLPTLDDWELQIRLARHGHTGDVIPRVLFSYRRHQTSLTFASPAASFVDEACYVLAKHADLVTEQALSTAQHLVYLWKNGIELSRSARWRARAVGASPPDQLPAVRS
ncbi:glycosyltransferase [Nonomuraea sp. NPDC049655]|uniref:glycosyltransferase n=1 Tax=Nonomuraea sp. NPDC049655 TaxID=3364355 RepID=UPI0037A58407